MSPRNGVQHNVLHNVLYNNFISVIFLDNFIDGEALILLIEDFKEFSHIIPQSGMRMKLKKLIENVCDQQLQARNFGRLKLYSHCHNAVIA